MKITTSRKTWIARIDDIEDVSGVDQFPLFSWFNLSTEAEMLGKMINWRNVEESEVRKKESNVWKKNDGPAKA